MHFCQIQHSLPVEISEKKYPRPMKQTISVFFIEEDAAD